VSNGKAAAPVVVSLDDPRAPDLAEAGAKAAVPARMRKAGFPVPDGRVFTARAMTQHMAGLEKRSRRRSAGIFSTPRSVPGRPQWP
jgi:phosphoenolpyruvate synthase/pyruvate phosphate dikinase